MKMFTFLEQTLTRPHSLKNKSFKGKLMRRKFYAVFAMLILLTLTLAACGGGSSDSGDKGESSSSGGDKPKVVAC